MSFDGVGMSQYTGGKEECFDKIISMHINIVNSIAKKSYADSRYHYIDLNAGPGEYDCDGSLIEGSPIKFLKAVCNKMPFKASLIEKDADVLQELRDSIRQYIDQHSDSIDIYHGDNENIFSSLYKDFSGKQLFGLIYSDPNNGIPPLNIFSQVCSNPIYKSMDLLTYIQAGFIKRAWFIIKVTFFLSRISLIGRITRIFWNFYS
jgi:three-Cys-motif partner protein